MVCFRYIIVNTQHKEDNKDNNNNNNDNDNTVAAIKIPILEMHHSATILLPSRFQTLKISKKQ
jgi:hypothetical protein